MTEINELTVVAVTADGFVQATQEADGYFVDGLELGDRLLVLTANSRYEFTLTNPAERQAIMQETKRFPEGALCTISGATFGGSMLQQGSVKVGMLLEFYVDEHRWVTSPVESLWVEADIAIRA